MNEILEKIEKITGKNRQQLVKYAHILGFILVVLGIGSYYITCLVGVAYPAFMSFLALESKGEQDDKQWLTYWVVFGFFNIVDYFSHVVLSVIPFYFCLKLLFLLWLMHPSSQGAIMLYDEFILPYVKQYSDHIEAVENSVSNIASNSFNYVKDSAAEGVNLVKDSAAQGVNKVKDSAAQGVNAVKDQVKGKDE